MLCAVISSVKAGDKRNLNRVAGCRDECSHTRLRDDVDRIVAVKRGSQRVKLFFAVVIRCTSHDDHRANAVQIAEILDDLPVFFQPSVAPHFRLMKDVPGDDRNIRHFLFGFLDECGNAVAYIKESEVLSCRLRPCEIADMPIGCMQNLHFQLPPYFFWQSIHSGLP